MDLTTYHRERYVDAVMSLQAWLGGRCARCGRTDELEFDHIDPASKCFDITTHWNWPFERLLPELQKCQLLCRPCHRRKTVQEGSNVGGGQNRITCPRHGTQVMYNRERCRCDPCCAWRRAYRAGLVDARGEPRHPCT